jgi:hypothetical protein
MKGRLAAFPGSNGAVFEVLDLSSNETLVTLWLVAPPSQLRLTRAALFR